MPSLRDDFELNTDDRGARIYQEAQLSNMSALRRGWESGRIGNELNPLQSDALDAQLAGKTAEEEALRKRIAALQLRQGAYAPAVGRVEDIHGVGDAASWAAGQIGQGAASMIDPMAVSAGLGTVGRIAGAIPHPIAKIVGGAAQLGALGIPYLMNKRQLSGEFIGNAQEDPELMARTSPQSLRDMSDMYGYAAAIPDTALPGMVGRQISGLSRAGSQAARQAAMGAGTKTLLGMTGEGATEALQSAGSQYARGELNPNRDTSGDFMENVNSFAGGAVGAGPFAGAGAYAEAGHNRLGAGVDAVKGAVGDVVDLANENATVQAAKESGRKIFSKAKETVVDLMSNDEGEISAKALVDNLKAGATDLKSMAQNSLDEHRVLSGTPPADIAQDDEKIREWMTTNDAARHQLVVDKLAAMPEEDPEAQQHLAAVTAEHPDGETQAKAIDAAAEFVMGRTPVGRAEERGNAIAEGLGRMAGVVAPAIGQGVVGVGKAAFSFGKAVLSGAQDGMRKKNEQADQTGPESFMDWRDRYYDVTGRAAAAQVLDEAATQRAELAGNYVEDMATRLNPRSPNMALLARNAAFTMADMTMIVGAKGIGAQNVRLNRLVDDIHGAFKTEAPEVLQQLGAIMGPKAAPVVKYMTDELAQRTAPGSQQRALTERDALARQVVGLIDPAAQNSLIKQGVNLNTPKGREQALHLMEDYADGIGSAPGARQALDRTFGAKSVVDIMTLLNGQEEKQQVGSVVDDRTSTNKENFDPNADEDTQTPDFDKNQAARRVASGAGPKVYGFHATKDIRTGSERSDPFAPTQAVGEDGVVQRPALFDKGQGLFGVKDTSEDHLPEGERWGAAINKKMADVRARMIEDPAYAQESSPGAGDQHDNYDIRPRTAHEVMKGMNMQPGKILQLYRDYMRMDAKNEKLPEGQRKYANQQAALAHSTILDGIQKQDADKKLQKYTFKTGPRDRSEVAQAAADYFKSKHVIVGEQISNQDPNKITLPEMLDMHKEGQGLIERARKSDFESGDQTKQALSDANVLMFKTAKGELAIPAGKLVEWVRKSQGKQSVTSAEDTSGKFSNKSKNDTYLSDLNQGITSLIGSGQVQGMPYKMNKFGKAEGFATGIPDSLRLATSTYGDMKFGEEQRRAGQTPKTVDELATVGSEGYDEKVSADQNRNADFFTAEDRAERDLVVDDKRTKPRKQQSQQQASDLGGELVTRDVGRGTSTRMRTDVSGQVAADPLTTEDDKTPLDFTRGQKSGAVKDEYADQRALSVQTGATTYEAPGPEPKGTAASSAKYRAADITRAYLENPARGQEMIKMRVRTALRPAFVGKEDETKGLPGAKQVVGGVHYIAPVAAFINPQNLADNNVDMPAATIQAIQQKVANILLKGDVSKTEKVKIARLMLDGQEKVTAMNVDAVLGRYAQSATKGKPIVAKTEAAPTQWVRAEDGHGQQVARMNTPGTKSRITVEPDPKAGGKWVRRLNNPVTGDERVVGGFSSMQEAQTAAPEVAGAGLPKGRATLSGTSEGRKLNAMAVDIHTDLQRGGFAATHDSPIRHEGKFDWRAHQGKGEGNASFGAGTYLSTADGVHKSYKRQFTAKSRDDDVGVYINGKHLTMFIGQDMSSGEKEWLSDGMSDLELSLAGWVADGHTLEDAKGMSLKQRDFWFANSEHALDAQWLKPYRALIKERKSLPAEFEYASIDAEDDLVDTATAKAVSRWNYFVGATKKWQAELDSIKSVVVDENKSPTYEVSVDIAPEQLLDWDAPLSEQSELVRKALGEVDAVVDPWEEQWEYHGATVSDGTVINITEEDGEFLLTWRRGDVWQKHTTLALAKAAAIQHVESFGLTIEAPKHGGDIYRSLVAKLGSQAKASDYLQSLGILGHKYAAAGGRNNTHPNYVIYDDSKITTNYVHFNQQDGPSKVSTQAERDAAIAYALKVLGPKIKVEFKDITGYSGEFIDAKNVIEISTTAAAGTMGTLYHEAMHVFFRDFVKGNPKVQAVFESLINDPKHLAKLHALLDGYPAAQAQLTSGEERLAYTYQFWKAGLLQVDAKAHTWLQKLGKFFRRVMGAVRDSERALELFEAFDNGKMSEPSAAGKVIAAAMAKGTNTIAFRRKMDAMFQGLAALTFPSAEILGRSVSPTARKLSTMLFTNPGEEAHGNEETGMMNARRNVAQQYINTSNRRFETMPEADQAAVQKYLQSETELANIPLADHREAVKDIRNLLERFHQYMTDSGMKIGKIDKYYPTVWNPGALVANKTEFINMLATKYSTEMNANDPYKAAERIWQSLVNKEGVDAHLPTNRDDGVLSPFFASQGQRTLPWIKGADKEKYLEKNMPLTLTRYFSQGAHATEYFRRFGEGGEKLEKMLSNINVELSGASKEMMKRGDIKDDAARVKWVGRQMRDVTQAVGAMEGSLGKDVSPNMRAFNSWMAVYQNIRLLPMALFSSFVDPLALVARGAPMQAAYETFTYGMREVFRGWADAFKDMPPVRQKDEWRKLSEAIGASEIAMFSHHVSDEYSSTYMTPGAKKLNDKMFVFNGMEAWNRGNRIMATKWAVRFLEQHAGLPDKHHSLRWLQELGLTPAMITKNAEGNLITNRHELAAHKGISLEQATKEIAPIHDALNRWVEGAVLTPNAAQRPAWSSDPNYASMFHLKQFSYSFHQTILKRATNEFSRGNMAPLGALAMFIPTMIGADIMKGLIQGAGSLPPYMAGMNAGDWMMHGAQRAGLSGIGVIGMDAATDWASLGGPAFEQIVDAARDGFGTKSALKAMPLNTLYGRLAA